MFDPRGRTDATRVNLPETNLASLTVVLHERLGNWARHLRPRLIDWPVRWVETRSSDDLRVAVAGVACPVVLIDLARRPRLGLDDLDLVVQSAPDALVLVLDPDASEGVAALARELGATHVLSGVAIPPDVAALVARWLPLARRRAERQGWSPASRPEPEPEPWNWLNPLLATPPGSARGPER